MKEDSEESEKNVKEDPEKKRKEKEERKKAEKESRRHRKYLDKIGYRYPVKDNDGNNVSWIKLRIDTFTSLLQDLLAVFIYPRLNFL